MRLTPFLQNLKFHGIKNHIPNITIENALFLQDLITLTHTKSLLEIGTANGFSTLCFAQAIIPNNWHITTIEFSQKSYDEAQENFKNSGYKEIITSLLGNALDIIPTLKENFDFVFIDGMKRRSLDFFLLTWEKVSPNGVIIIDDVIKFRHKMKDLFTHLQEQNITFHILPIDWDDGICMIVKK